MLKLSRKGIENIRRGLKRSWQPGGTHYAHFKRKEIDADTMRKRAQWDRKGALACTVTMSSGAAFEVRYSTSHALRLDIFHAGRKVATCREGLALGAIWNFLL